MFFKENGEKEVEQLLRRDKEVSEQIMRLFEDLQFTPEQLENYLSNRENFTAEEWEFMEVRRREMEEKLERDLENIPNPEKTKEAYKLRRQTSNWIQI